MNTILQKYKKVISLCVLALGIFGFGIYLKSILYAPLPLVIKSDEQAIIPYFEISYTDNGYEPSSLEIPVNSKVGFKNNSSLPMWTASDPHPIHTDFSSFDARETFLPGETYVFSFTKLGTFWFHNHEKSLHRGMIKVIDPKNPLPNIDKTKESQKTTRDKYLAMFKPNDPLSVNKVITAIENNGALARDCHDMAHDLGHKAYELYGFSGAMTFNQSQRLGNVSVDDICAGGYMHGILEEVFLNQPELKQDPSPICAPILYNNSGSCFHGVGHGLMFVNKRSVPLALADCKKLNKKIDSLRCYEGVWMEMFWGDTGHAGADSLGWTLETPLAPCINAGEDEKPGCFLYAHLGYLRSHPRDYEGAVNLCTKSGLIPKDTQFCLKGIGITLMKHFTSHHLEETEVFVKGFGYWEKYAYYQGVIGYARLSSVSDDNLTLFCNNLKTDTKICLKVIKNEPK